METCNYTQRLSLGCPEPRIPMQEAQTAHKAIANHHQGAIPPGNPLTGCVQDGMGRRTGLGKLWSGSFPGIASCSEDFAVVLSA